MKICEIISCFETPFVSKKQSKESFITYYKILDLPSVSFEIE